MSYSTLPAPSDIFGVNSGIRSRVFPLNNDRRSEESHSPTSEPRSPLFRPALPAAELPPHLVSLYNSPYAAAAVAAAMAGQGSGAPATSATHFGHFGRVPGSFYPTMVGGEAWRRPPYLSQFDMYWPGLRSLEAVVGPRTKAPREATSILKSWLNEHKDNPYPTKSEKMTLSIVTHMTLTQVSTWFANARRRIKKENKMTWTPKTRSGERGDDNSSNEEESDRDYFGRHPRSPFLTSRHSSEGSLPSLEESKRAGIQQQGRSTIPSGQPSLRPPHNYPVFSGLNGLSPEYRRQNRDTITTRADDIKFPVRRTSHSNESNSDDTRVNNNNKLHRQPPLVKKQPTSDDQASADEDKDLNRPPFIQLGKRRSYSIEQNVSTTDSTAEDQNHSPKRPHYSHPTPPTRSDEHYVSNVYGQSMHHRNADVISTWMKDFQQLVATGQEDKARHALAAFALAAKAGAYPEIGRNTIFHQVRGSHQNNPLERSKSPVDHPSCHSPTNQNRQIHNSVPFPPRLPNNYRQDDRHSRSVSSGSEASVSLSNSPIVEFAATKRRTSNHCTPKSTGSRSEILCEGRTISEAERGVKRVENIKGSEDSAK